MRRQEYFTALEIAELAKRLDVSAMPQTKRRVQDLIVREGWASSPLSRVRSGRGGGHEYHFSLLPEFMVSAMIADEQKAQALADAKTAMVTQENALEKLASTSLSARQRMVMEARASIVNAVNQYYVGKGSTKGEAVAAVLEMTVSDIQLSKLAREANDRAGKVRTISRATLYEWLKLHKAGGVSALAPKATRDTHSFPEWFPKFMAYYARPQAPTITEALDNYKYDTRTNNPPSYDQVRRCLKKLDKSKGTQARFRGREGALAIKARHAYVVRDTSGLLPTSVYTADGKTFDAEVQHPIHGRPFRPEITSILDVATRVCVGWSIGLAENSDGVLDALRMSCMEYGIPAIFYVDRGPGFKNDKLDNDLTGFCARFGTTKMHSLPYNSQARGIIERFNGSVYNPMARKLPTYIGVDMDREARHKAFKITRKDIKTTGTSNLLLSWPDFIEQMKYEIKVYNDKAHAGLTIKDQSGRKVLQSPNEAWEKCVSDGFEAVGVHPGEADDLFRQYVRRRTNRAMVEIFTNSYFHIDLEAHHGTDILVGFDIHDGGKVWCREIDVVDGEERPGRLIAVAIFEGNKTRYVPLTAERAAMEKRTKARMGRLQNKMDEVEAEANPNRFLDQSANKPMEIINNSTGDNLLHDPVEAAPQTIGQGGAAKIQKRTIINGRPAFSDDASLAKWCCENEGEVTAMDRSLLRELLNSKSDREYLRLEGVDLEALRKLSQSVA